MSTFFKASLGLVMRFVPWDTVIAFVINFAFDKLLSTPDRKDTYDKTVTTIGHAAEALAVAQSILEDGTLTSDEIKQASNLSSDLRKKLLETWADRGDSKTIETAARADNSELDERMMKVEEMRKAAIYKESLEAKSDS